MNASMSEKIRSLKLRLSKQQKNYGGCSWWQVKWVKWFWRSNCCKVFNTIFKDVSTWMSPAASWPGELRDTTTFRCRNNHAVIIEGAPRSTMGPFPWFLQGSPSSIAETHGVWNHLAAVAELPIYTKENSTKKLMRVHLQALWNYDQIMWWCDIMCLLDLISTSELPHTHDNLVQRLKDPKILLHFQTFAMEFAPLWPWPNRLSPTLPSGSFMRMIL